MTVEQFFGFVVVLVMFLAIFGEPILLTVLGAVWVVGSFIILYLMLVTAIPKDNKDTVNLALGFVLGGLVSGVAGFYFGASKGEGETKKPE